MNKTPTRISLLSLLISLEGHRNLLLRILNEAHVGQDITVEKFGGIMNNLTVGRHLSFSEEEIPTEGRGHNQPLHISVKCGDYIIARVQIDNGSSLNVLPTRQIMLHQFPAKGQLGRSMGPKERSWAKLPSLSALALPPASWADPGFTLQGAVPSSLHQKVKFIADQQLVSVMGEQELMISTPTPDGYLEDDEKALEISF
ncbi:hypothetical protein CR513_01442, partial [Mucuna pruriens]